MHPRGTLNAKGVRPWSVWNAQKFICAGLIQGANVRAHYPSKRAWHLPQNGTVPRRHPCRRRSSPLVRPFPLSPLITCSTARLLYDVADRRQPHHGPRPRPRPSPIRPSPGHYQIPILVQFSALQRLAGHHIGRHIVALNTVAAQALFPDHLIRKGGIGCLSSRYRPFLFSFLI